MLKKPYTTNILNFLEDKTNAYSERIALGMKSQYGWVEYTYSGLGMMARKIASYLIEWLQNFQIIILITFKNSR